MRRARVVGALVVLVASVASLSPTSGFAACTLKTTDLVGAWERVGASGYFEEMAFTVDGDRRVFDSWLHDRPEVSGGSWSIDDCTVRITGASDASLTFAFHARLRDRRHLELKEPGEALATYRRLPR